MSTDGSSGIEPDTHPPPLKQFKLLSQDMRNRLSAAAGVSALGVDAELDHYIQKAGDVSCDNGLAFWQQRESSYPLVAPVAEDLVAVPSSQAYGKRTFSACGDLCSRKRNRASATLES